MPPAHASRRPALRTWQLPARHAARRHRDAAALAGGAARAVAVPAVIAAVATASAPGWTAYRVQPGETLSGIAQRSGTSVAALVEANGLPAHGHYVRAGAVVQVPRGRSAARSAPATRTRTHRVSHGQTLWSIAQRYGTTVRALSTANGLASSLIRPGQVLRVGATTTRTAAARPSALNSFAGRTYPDHVVASASANRAELARRGVPSRERVRDVIAETARAHGVDPALALAVSWQETGWQHDEVSVANAIGAMQVIPATGEWMSGVVGRDLDLLDPRDNATAGVVLLDVLLGQAESEAQALAGYYQGLASVRSRGPHPDTKAYVRNVLALKQRFS